MDLYFVYIHKKRNFMNDSTPDNTFSQKKEEASTLDKSLQHLYSSAELDQNLAIVKPRLWLAYWILLFLVILILLWAFFGSIPIRVEGKGIFISQKGLFNVQAKTSGIIQRLLIKPDNFVKQDDVIAEIIDPQDQLKLELANSKVDILQKDLDRLKNEIESERKKEKEAISREIEARKFNIEKYEKEVETLKKELQTKQGLVKEGLIAQTSVRETEKELNQRQINLETINAEIVTLYSNLNKGYRTEEFKSKEQLLLQAKQDQELFQMTREYGNVTSPSDGYVLEVLFNQGDRVTSGAALVLLEYSKNVNSSDLIYGYVPVNLGKRIKPGTPVQIEVSTVRKEEYGKMLGTVTEISQFALSPERLAKEIPNQALISYLLGDQKAVIKVLISPQVDPSTPSGYRWTSGKGPNIHITTGTVCLISSIIERVRPFYYVLPFQTFREVVAETPSFSRELTYE